MDVQKLNKQPQLNSLFPTDTRRSGDHTRSRSRSRSRSDAERSLSRSERSRSRSRSRSRVGSWANPWSTSNKSTSVSAEPTRATSHKFPEGWFVIRNRKHGSVISISKDHITERCSRVQASQPKKRCQTQLWKYEDGVLRNKASNSILNVRGGYLRDNTRIVHDFKSADTDKQKWDLTPDGFILNRANPSLVLALKERVITADVFIQERKARSHLEQRWEFVLPKPKEAGHSSESEEVCSLASDASEDINDKFSTFPEGPFFIESSSTRGFVMSFDGTRLVLHKLDVKNYTKSLWIYRNECLVNDAFNFVISVNDAFIHGAQIVVSPSEPFVIAHQSWALNIDGYIFNRTHPELALGVADEADLENTEVQLLDRKYGGQRWRFLLPIFRKQKVRESTLSSFFPIDFYIKSFTNELVLGVKDNSRASGAKLVLCEMDHHHKNYLWYYDNNGYLRNRATGYVMGTEAGKLVDGAQMIQSDDATDKWSRKTEIGGSSICIRDHPEFVLGVADEANAVKGTSVQLFQKKGGYHSEQRWSLLTPEWDDTLQGNLIESVEEAVMVFADESKPQSIQSVPRLSITLETIDLVVAETSWSDTDSDGTIQSSLQSEVSNVSSSTSPATSLHGIFSPKDEVLDISPTISLTTPTASSFPSPTNSLQAIFLPQDDDVVNNVSLTISLATPTASSFPSLINTTSLTTPKASSFSSSVKSLEPIISPQDDAFTNVSSIALTTPTASSFSSSVKSLEPIILPQDDALTNVSSTIALTTPTVKSLEPIISPQVDAFTNVSPTIALTTPTVKSLEPIISPQVEAFTNVPPTIALTTPIVKSLEPIISPQVDAFTDVSPTIALTTPAASSFPSSTKSLQPVTSSELQSSIPFWRVDVSELNSDDQSEPPRTVNFEESTAVFAIDISGSVQGSILATEKSIVNSLATSPHHLEHSEVVPWDNRARTPISISEVNTIEASGGTSPACIMIKQESAQVIQQSDIWFLVTDGLIGDSGVQKFAELIRKNNITHIPAVTVIVGNAVTRKDLPAKIDISVGVAVFSSIDHCLFLYADSREWNSGICRFYLLQAKGCFESLGAVDNLDESVLWSDLPIVNPDALSSNVLTKTKARVDGGVIRLNDSLHVHIDSLLAPGTTLTRDDIGDVFENETARGALFLACKVRGLLKSLRAFMNRHKPEDTAVEGSADLQSILSLLTLARQSAVPTDEILDLQRLLREAYQRNEQRIVIERALGELVEVERGGFLAKQLARSSNRAACDEVVSEAECNGRLDSLPFNSADTNSFRGKCPNCCDENVIMALTCKVLPTEKIEDDFALNFPLACGSALHSADILGAQIVCFRCANYAMHEGNGEAASVIVPLVSLAKNMKLWRVRLSAMLANNLQFESRVQLLIALLDESLGAQATEDNAETKLKRDALEWTLTMLWREFKTNKNFEKTSDLVQFSEAVAFVVKEASLVAWSADSWLVSYPLEGFLRILHFARKFDVPGRPLDDGLHLLHTHLMVLLVENYHVNIQRGNLQTAYDCIWAALYDGSQEAPNIVTTIGNLLQPGDIKRIADYVGYDNPAFPFPAATTILLRRLLEIRKPDSVAHYISEMRAHDALVIEALDHPHDLTDADAFTVLNETFILLPSFWAAVKRSGLDSTSARMTFLEKMKTNLKDLSNTTKVVPRVRLHPTEGPEVSEFICGNMQGKDCKTPEKVLDLIHACLEVGITTFDTAEICGDGLNERLFGDALKMESGLRDKIEIVTKCNIDFSTAQNYDSTYECIVSEVKRLLEELGVEYIDVLLIHGHDYLMDADDIAKAMVQLRYLGNIRHWGVSNYSASTFRLVQSRLPFPLVTNKIELGVTCFDAMQNGVLELAQEQRIRSMTWSPLFKVEDADEQTSRLQDALSKVAAEFGEGVTTDQIAYAFNLAHPSHPTITLSINSVDCIKTAAAVYKKGIKLNRRQWYSICKAREEKNVA